MQATRGPEEQTTMRVKRRNRDALAARAKELGVATLDEALETILFRQKSYEAIARLSEDPAALADYQREARELAEADAEVQE
jgi:hypothetical protein